MQVNRYLHVSSLSIGHVSFRGYGGYIFPYVIYLLNVNCIMPVINTEHIFTLISGKLSNLVPTKRILIEMSKPK